MSINDIQVNENWIRNSIKRKSMNLLNMKVRKNKENTILKADKMLPFCYHYKL